MIQAQVSSSRPVSTNAEKFSTLPWPYWWSASAGLSETPTEKNVSSDAIKSEPGMSGFRQNAQAAGGDADHNFQAVVMTIAARTEFPAAERFSARISSDGEMAGFPDMLALSPLRPGCAKQFAARSLDRFESIRADQVIRGREARKTAFLC